MSAPATGRRALLWSLAIGIATLAAAALAFGLNPQLWSALTDPQVARDWLAGWGPWAPVVFVALQILQVVVFVIPGEVTQVAGGWIFGFVTGSALSLLGIMIGSTIAFVLSRRLGVRFVHRIAGPGAVRKFDGLMASPQFVGSLFLLFLIPGIPKDILCYVAGLSQLRFGAFVVVSGLARLPGILGSSLMGKALFQGDWLLLALVGGIALVLFGVGWACREPIFRLVERFALSHPREKDPS